MIDQGFNREELGNYFDLFIDQSREVKFPDVVSETNGVQLSPTPTTRFKSSDAAYWGRFQVENAIDRDMEPFVEFPYPALDYLTFCEPDGVGGHRVTATGDYIRFDARPVPYEGYQAPDRSYRELR